jgi:hypothetical protein
MTKFIWNFAIYCKKNEDIERAAQITCGKSQLAYKVVLDLDKDLQGNEHLISIDNFFTSVGPYEELVSKKIYATSTMRINQVSLLVLKNTCTF